MNQPVYHPPTMNHAASLAAALPSPQSPDQQQQQQQQCSGVEPVGVDPTRPAGGTAAADVSLPPPDPSVVVEASNVDHALLESLFYNEMAAYEPSDDEHQQRQRTSSITSTSSSTGGFLSHQLAEMTTLQQQQQPPHHSDDHNHFQLQQEMNNFVEQEILRDFEMGLSTTTAPWHATNAVPPPPQSATDDCVGLSLEQGTTNEVAASATEVVPTLVDPSLAMMKPPPDHVATTQQQQQQQQHNHQSLRWSHDPEQQGEHVADVLPTQQRRPAPIIHRTESFIAAGVSQTQGVPQERARRLVDQFATLASRLGIDLPDTVLESLTTAAAKNDPSDGSSVSPLLQHNHESMSPFPTNPEAGAFAAGFDKEGTKPAALANTREGATTASSKKRSSSVAFGPIVEASSMSENTEANLPSTILESQKVAEEAIAMATQRRSSLEIAPASEVAAAAAAAAASVAGKQPSYSKRRKKPRLQDCESKLAQLRAENEQLKRHLLNVSNKANKFDKDKEEAGKRIAQLLRENAGPDQMSQAVREFSDMYSDYGVNRQQELNFHLTQLQRLVNPTNFTKMGLWTLGQSSHDNKRNPIAGILVKELTITAQQGRKILDQGEKIRKLCQNLKETHALLGKLKALCEKKTRIFQDRMSKCTEILTSKQVVALIMWINEHTELLGSVCPGWGTEHIHSK